MKDYALIPVNAVIHVLRPKVIHRYNERWLRSLESIEPAKRYPQANPSKSLVNSSNSEVVTYWMIRRGIQMEWRSLVSDDPKPCSICRAVWNEGQPKKPQHKLTMRLSAITLAKVKTNILVEWRMNYLFVTKKMYLGYTMFVGAH